MEPHLRCRYQHVVILKALRTQHGPLCNQREPKKLRYPLALGAKAGKVMQWNMVELGKFPVFNIKSKLSSK